MMNSCILNGSPKPAKYSVTCQTVHYLHEWYPSTIMRSLLGTWIRSLENGL